MHTDKEVLPVVDGQMPPRRLVQNFLRCRWTGKTGRMDLSVLRTIVDAAMHFQVTTVKIVSAFRHPKFNEYLRKKCRQVARRSRHVLGQAIDFSLPGVPVDALYDYLLGLRFGGIGHYPGSQFIHLDSGPVRTWQGGNGMLE